MSEGEQDNLPVTRGEFREVVNTLGSKIDKLSDEVSRKTTPDRSRDIAIAAVFLTFLGMMAYAGIRESDSLDIRLQREMRQTNDTTLERVEGVDKLSQHRHDELRSIAHANQERIAKLEAHEWDLVMLEKQELSRLREKTQH